MSGAGSVFDGLLERHGGWAIPLVLALVTVAVFLPALENGFVNWDDPQALVDNPHYRGLGWTQLRWVLTTFLMGHYSPLAWFTFAVDYLLWGMNPAGYHFTSLLLHVANAVLFYFVARRLLRAAAPGAADAGPEMRLFGGVAALLFAIHPLRVESVAWASDRRDVLCGFFFLAAVLAYLRAVETADVGRRRRWQAASLGAFVAALLSKATAMPLPAVLLLLDLYPLRRLQVVGWRRLVVEKMPYGVLVGASAVVATIAKTHADWAMEAHGLGTRLAIAGYGLMFYPWKFLWPVGLSPLYEWLGPADLLAWRFLFPTLSFAIVTAGLVAGRRRWPGALAAWVFSALMVLPVSGLVMRAGPYLAADRYSYLSGLGWALLGGGALRHWSLARRWPVHGGRRAAVLAGLLVVVIGTLGTLTRGQIHVWRDSETLWTHTTSLAPSSIAHFNLGMFLETRGLRQKAAEHYRGALAINPDLAQAHSSLGLVLAQENRVPEAIVHLREDVRLNPGSSRARKNLATVLARQGRTAEAIEHLRRAVQLSPGDASAHNDLGNVLAVQGQLDEAVQHYQEVLKITPDSPEMHNNLGMALALQGRKSEAVEHFRRALAIRPGFPVAQKNLDWTLAGRSPAR